jgi:hypothetical protein
MITLSVVLAAGAASAGLAAPAALASVNGVDGGVNMNAACIAQYPNSTVTGAYVDYSGNVNVYDWYCSSDYGATSIGGINIDEQCVAQYGPGSVAQFSDYNDPYTWYCYS